MPAAYVQSNLTQTDGTASTTIVVTLPGAVTVGNWIAVYGAWNSGGVSPASRFSSLVDDLGNTYTTVDSLNDTDSDDHRTFYAKVTNGGTPTITLTLTNACGYRSLVAHEVSGLDATAPLDQHTIVNQASPGTGTDGVTTGNVTTTTDGQYIFGATHLNNTTTQTIAAGTGFTGRESNSGGGDTPPFRSEDQIQSVAGSVAATFTLTVDQHMTTAIMTFKAAAGGGATSRAKGGLLLVGVGS